MTTISLHTPDMKYLRGTFSIDGVLQDNNQTFHTIRTYKKITFVLTANTTFKDAPYLFTGSINRTFVLSNGNKTATLEHMFSSSENTPELSAGWTTQGQKQLTFHGQNTTLQVIRGINTLYKTLRNGQTANIDADGEFYEFRLQADSGYEFTRYGTLQHGTDPIREIPVLSQTDNTYTRIRINRFEEDTTITMNAEKIEEVIPTEVLGFNHIYLVDKDKLSDISEDIFRKRRSYIIADPDNPHPGARIDPYIATDPHRYIINTLQLPFSIDTVYQGNQQPIVLGYTALLPRATTILKDRFTLNLGKIATPRTHNNSYDYKATDIILHLPYTNPLTLEPNYVIGHTISIEYLVDAYSGETTINLRSTFTNNKVFLSTNTHIGNQIPFASLKDDSTIGDPKGSKAVLHNNTPTPYIEVLRNKAHQMNSRFNRDIKTTVGKIYGIKGHIYVNSIDIQADITLEELISLKGILAGGIHIK